MEILLLVAIVAVGAVWYYNAQAKKPVSSGTEPSAAPAVVEVAPSLAAVVETAPYHG